MPSRRPEFGALLGTGLCLCTVLSSEPFCSAPGLTEVELKAAFLLRLPLFVSFRKYEAQWDWAVDGSFTLRTGQNDRDYRLGNKATLGG